MLGGMMNVTYRTAVVPFIVVYRTSGDQLPSDG